MLGALPLPPRRIHRIAVSSYFFLTGLCFFSWDSRIPDIKAKLNLNIAGTGAVLMSLPVGSMVSLPLAGWLVARIGSRPVAIAAGLLYAVVLPLLGSVTQIWQLVACLFLFGMGGNLLNISINTQAIGTETLYGRTIMASYHGLWSLAGFAGASLANMFMGFGWLPWQHFLVISGMALLIVLFASGRLLDTGAGQRGQPIFVKPDRSLVNLGIIAFCSMICEGSMFDWSNLYWQHVVLPPKFMMGFGLTAFSFTMAGGRFVGDSLATRWGIRRMLQISGALTAGGLLLAIVFPFLLPALAGFLFVGAGVSSVVPLVYSAAGRSKVMSPGVALAAVSTIGYLGFLIGPPFIGFIAQVSSLRVSLGLIAVLGSLIVVMAGRTKFD